VKRKKKMDVYLVVVTLCEKEEEDGCLPSSCADKACIQCSLLNDEKSSDVRGED
jgi:hypothetical protein